MTNKENVLSIYPDAVVLGDTHNYGTEPGGVLPFLIIHNLPNEFRNQVKNDEITLDFTHLRSKIKINPLSVWCRTIDAAWLNAWAQMQNKFNLALSK
jgi:hypothetical protein